MNIFPSATLSEIYKWIRVGKIKVNKKKKIVCNDCQRKYSQKEILEKLK